MQKTYKKSAPKKTYRKPTVVRTGAAMASGSCPKCTEGNCGIAYRTGW